ncbi:hypothetical protein FIBSPDRAFT_855036 [Athelia psychrophila]|uniref:Uncharacterized protein n=1 Tax=Athelia psychrophila TaxID=1759441 RepID=A0A166PSK7_9AGAM|nr:hypothetical protein FIBSPDRAFT_855036 [Fibularhizoctonia sp. CBS 109695]
MPKNQLMPGLQKSHVNMTHVPETALLLIKPRAHHRGLLPSHSTTLVRSRETVVFLYWLGPILTAHPLSLIAVRHPRRIPPAHR